MVKSFFNKDQNIIITETDGEVKSETIKESARSALQVSIEENCPYLIFDIRQNKPGQSIVEGFTDMESMQRMGFSLYHKVAIIFDPSLYPRDRAEFIETVVRNRKNPSFQMFTSMEEAVEWLKSFQ